VLFISEGQAHLLAKKRVSFGIPRNPLNQIHQIDEIDEIIDVFQGSPEFFPKLEMNLLNLFFF